MSFRYIRYFMDVAKLTANLSHAEKLKVGSIIVKEGRIISIGYNGTPSGWDNTCEDKQVILDIKKDSENKDDTELVVKMVTKSEVIHAEENAILKLARDGESGKNASIYITHAPCLTCSRLIYNSGINSVYYEKEYRDTSGIEFLNKCGISVQKIGDIEQQIEKTEEKIPEKLTREKFRSLYKNNKLKMTSLVNTPIQVMVRECFPGFSSECVAFINIESSEVYAGLKKKSPIFETEQEIFDWISDVLYNLYEIGEILVQEDS